MSTTRHHAGLIPIPPGDVPEGFRCVSVYIPDADAYLQELVGLISRAASWVSYERDPQQKPYYVATAWKNALRQEGSFQACGGNMQIRACTDGCGIEYSNDGGSTWTCVELSGCIADLVSEGISNAMSDGAFQSGTTEQGPVTPGEIGTCKTYHVRLTPGAKWLCPQPMRSGDTILVSNATGGWSLGELAWYCPDGARYLLGTCDSSLHSHVAGDLLNPGAWHMAVVGLWGTTYFDPLTAAYTIPAGHADMDVYLMANTGLTGVPSGEAVFDVTVCRGGWCHYFDFRTSSDHTGLTLVKGSYLTDSYTDEHVSTYWAVYFSLTLPANSHFLNVQMEVSQPAAADTEFFCTGGPNSPNYGAGHKTVSFNPTSAVTAITFYVANSNGLHQSKIYNIRLSGWGPDPFAGHVCP